MLTRHEVSKGCSQLARHSVGGGGNGNWQAVSNNPNWRWTGSLSAISRAGVIGDVWVAPRLRRARRNWRGRAGPAFDILIRNGVIYDGSGGEEYLGGMDEWSSFDARIQSRLCGAYG